MLGKLPLDTKMGRAGERGVALTDLITASKDDNATVAALEKLVDAFLKRFQGTAEAEPVVRVFNTRAVLLSRSLEA